MDSAPAQSMSKQCTCSISADFEVEFEKHEPAVGAGTMNREYCFAFGTQDLGFRGTLEKKAHNFQGDDEKHKWEAPCDQ